MHYLKNHIVRQRYFFISFLLLLAVAVVCCVVYDKGPLFLSANGYHARLPDLFFINYTFLGDGLFVLMVALAFFVSRRYELFMQTVASFLLSGLFIQVVKRLMPAPRPKAFFAEGVYQHFLDGVTHSGINSFPSGHTTSAFALATVLACCTRGKGQAVLFLLLAVVVGYSRIYLGQHFVHDVVAGAVIGVCCALVTIYYIRDVAWLDQQSVFQFKLGV